MGPDQYLEARTCNVGGYAGVRKASYGNSEEVRTYDAIMEACGLTDTELEVRSIDLSFSVGYWRKANAVHQWFVRNVQNNEDDCEAHYVSNEDLLKLLAVCKNILSTVDKGEPEVEESYGYISESFPDLTLDTELADSTLPTQSGFFFGGTAYDEYYVEDLERTVDIIEKLQKSKFWDNFNFYYRASW